MGNAMRLILLFILAYAFITASTMTASMVDRNVMQPSAVEANAIRQRLDDLAKTGNHNDILLYLQEVETKYGSLLIDDNLPSMYNIRGVSQHNAQMVDDSANSFLQAVTIFPQDLRSWINLGEARCHQFRLNEAITAFGEALKLGGIYAGVVPRLLRAKGWACSWRDFEKVASMAEQLSKSCSEERAAGCGLEGAGGLEYTDVAGWVQRQLHTRSPNAADSPYRVPAHERAGLWESAEATTAVHSEPIQLPKVVKRLKVAGMNILTKVMRIFLLN